MLTKTSVFKALTLYQATMLPKTSLCAAVMIILLIDDQENIEAILTKRATTLSTYAGDVSFPGGIKEEDDADLLTTAKREVWEELGLPVDAYQYLSQLDDFQDRFGNLVRPFISWMSKQNFAKLHKIETLEIAELIYFPLSKLSAIKDDPSLYSITRRQPSYSYRENDVYIWGLTATILVHILNIISNDHKPLGKIITLPS